MADIDGALDAIGEHQPSDHAFATPTTSINLLRATMDAHYHLSQMADQKASILMGATFVIFTIAVGQGHGGAGAPLPLLVLGGFAFVSAVLAIISVLPAVGAGKPNGNPLNLLFFGSFTAIGREHYVESMLAGLKTEERAYRMMAEAIYDNGAVLKHKKYRWLGYAYRVFLAGLICSFATFTVEFALHH